MKGLFKIVLVFCCLVLLWNPLGSCNEGAQLILSLDLRTFGYRHPVAERDFRAYAFLQVWFAKTMADFEINDLACRQNSSRGNSHPCNMLHGIFACY
jgi:hypothetical protein